jgi:DNA-binding MarR family transcriptional regulator
MSLFKISNQIFALGLDYQEFSVYAYLCSLPINQYRITGESIATVKQATIAQKCGIKAVQTVSKIITRLKGKGLVEPLKRNIKANRFKGTYQYAVHQLKTDSGYFSVDRSAFGQLTPRQIVIYFFICKSYSLQLRDCWNSFNDISQQTGMKREMVVQTIKELEDMKMIVRIRKKARNNNRVYVDNHYQIIFYVKGRIKGKKTVRLHLEYNRTNSLEKPSHVHCYISTESGICQDLFYKFFFNRGSPSD